MAETLAIERAKKLFGADHVNVQPHAGSQANQAVYVTALKPGDTMLGMSLAHGGHLTHGHPLNFSGRMYKVVSYGVRNDTETIDYKELELLASEHEPKLIVAGASAYPRTIDFERLERSPKRVAQRSWSTSRTLRGSWPPDSIPAPSRTPILSPPPRIRPCADRAAAW